MSEPAVVIEDRMYPGEWRVEWYDDHKLSELAHAWWHDRVAPDWVPHTREQNQAILDRLGLTGDFWRLG